MDESIEQLQQSLQLYETQLSQINEAISSSDDNSDELLSLHNNITELILLTKESLESKKSQDTNSDDPLAREYELFKAELQVETAAKNEATETADNIEEELNSLIGTKCQAPYSEQWSSSSETYHNALIVNINTEDALDNIKVKVMFVNPTCREMIPCQYYLDGECKFADDQCHFSHGYAVYFSDLKEYKEPNFNLLRENAAVLAKDEDNLWKRAKVTAVLSEQNQCSVKFESGTQQESIIDVHYTLPLGENDEENYSNLTDEESQGETEEDWELRNREAMIEKSLTQEPPSTKLGEWEKYTTGIGSKLMASMGYIAGTGLGKRGEGRVEPVVAVALPPRQSLDYCMTLREKAGGDPNLFRADKLQKKLKRRKQHVKKSVPNVVPKKSNDVFSFINDSLSGTSSKKSEALVESSTLKMSTSKALNIEELKINERMDKKRYELMVLQEKLSRQKHNTIGRSTLMKQVREVEGQIRGMEANLKNLDKEKLYRKTMKELTEF